MSLQKGGQFKREAVELYPSSEKSVPKVAKEFSLGIADESLRRWIKQQEVDEGGEREGLTTEERQELSRLPLGRTRPSGRKGSS